MPIVISSRRLVRELWYLLKPKSRSTNGKEVLTVYSPNSSFIYLLIYFILKRALLYSTSRAAPRGSTSYSLYKRVSIAAFVVLA